jgi:hypothetical protein
LSRGREIGIASIRRGCDRRDHYRRNPQSFSQQLAGVQRLPAAGRDDHLRLPRLDGPHELIHRGVRAFSGEGLGPPGDALGTACRRKRGLNLRVHHRVHHSHRSLANSRNPLLRCGQQI